MSILDQGGKPIEEKVQQPQFIFLKELIKARKKLNQRYPPNSDDAPLEAKVGDTHFFLAKIQTLNGHQNRSWMYDGKVAME